MTIAVFCGSNYGASEEFANGALVLGRVLGKAGITMVYGGTTKGLMGVVADAALASGGNVHGVITESLHQRGQAHFPFYCLAANAEKASSGSLEVAQDEAQIPQ